MIIPAEDIVGCEVFFAYSAQKVFVWLYPLLRLQRKAQSIGMQFPPREAGMPRGVPGTVYSCWVAGSPGACSVSVLEGEGRTHTCKHGLLLSWSCRAIHHQFDMCSAGNIYFSS